MALFNRKTFIPGATRVLDSLGLPIPKGQVVRDELGVPVFPLQVNPMWRMPKPYHTAMHFKSAGARAKFERGEIEKPQAMKAVPVYRGLDIRVFRALRNDQKQEIKRRNRKRNRWGRFAQKMADFAGHYGTGVMPMKDAI